MSAKEICEPKDDKVYSPRHYTSLPAYCSACASKLECIDIVRHMGFELGNAIKYIWRAEYKENKREQILKAIWYLNDYLNHFATTDFPEVEENIDEC